MARRLIIAAGWLAAAVLAVLVGLVAVSVIGDGLVSPLAEPLSSSEVAKELAAAPDESAAPAPSPVPSVLPAPAPEVRTFPTRAGTVVAACDGDEGTIQAMSPAQGFAVHERSGNEGEFRGVADHHDRVKIEISCADGRPEAEIRSETDDD